jgi:glycosyltransferase involved in cell wall biosynthesis
MNIIITMPAYNEENTIGPVLEEIKQVMKSTKYKYKLLVVNDGSTDNTFEVAKKAGAIVQSHKRNKGLAETFKEEMRQCLKLKADVIVHTDADGQYDASSIPALIEKTKEHDLVLGSRFKGRIESMPVMKRFGNKAFAKVLSHLTKTSITDSTTGFRAFTREVAENIHYINTFTYTQEQIIRAAKQKFTIIEIPIRARKTRDSRLFGSPFEYAIKAWINILRIYRDYEPIKFFGYVGVFFFGLGFFLGLWILFTWFVTGTVGALPRVILTMLLLSVGIQIGLFGFLADMYRK